MSHFEEYIVGILKSERNLINLQAPLGSGKSTKFPAEVHAVSCLKVVVMLPGRTMAVSLAKFTNKKYIIGGQKDREKFNLGDVTYITYGIMLTHFLKFKAMMQREHLVIIADEIHELNPTQIFVLHLLRTATPYKLILMSGTMPDFAAIQMPEFATPLVDIKIAPKFSRLIEEHPFDVQLGAALCDLKHKIIPHVTGLVFRHRQIASQKFNMLIIGLGKYDNSRIADSINKYDDFIIVCVDGTAHHSVILKRIETAFADAAKHDKSCIIIATAGLAGSSITIPGIDSVIHIGGLKRLVTYNGHDFLECVPCTQQQADQAAGRTGRTCNGVIYRCFAMSELKTIESSALSINVERIYSQVLWCLKNSHNPIDLMPKFEASISGAMMDLLHYGFVEGCGISPNDIAGRASSAGSPKITPDGEFFLNMQFDNLQFGKFVLVTHRIFDDPRIVAAFLLVVAIIEAFDDDEPLFKPEDRYATNFKQAYPEFSKCTDDLEVCVEIVNKMIASQRIFKSADDLTQWAANNALNGDKLQNIVDRYHTMLSCLGLVTSPVRLNQADVKLIRGQFFMYFSNMIVAKLMTLKSLMFNHDEYIYIPQTLGQVNPINDTGSVSDTAHYACLLDPRYDFDNNLQYSIAGNLFGIRNSEGDVCYKLMFMVSIPEESMDSAPVRLVKDYIKALTDLETLRAAFMLAREALEEWLRKPQNLSDKMSILAINRNLDKFTDGTKCTQRGPIKLLQSNIKAADFKCNICLDDIESVESNSMSFVMTNCKCIMCYVCWFEYCKQFDEASIGVKCPICSNQCAFLCAKKTIFPDKWEAFDEPQSHIVEIEETAEEYAARIERCREIEAREAQHRAKQLADKKAKELELVRTQRKRVKEMSLIYKR